MITTVENSLDSIGVHTDGVSTSPLADVSITRALPPEAQQMMQLSIENGYKRFITLVADARHSTPEQIDKSPRATSGPVRMQKLTGWSIVSGISMMRSPKQQSWQK
ncbi:signal peptide peptidase SppA, 67K type [Escherichia coli]|uniref:Signal peptide peptidase SppA, 67K type n=1 Tax=Escherichia coli TaxID=562 RepID=A0A376J422_ECOLX|nr:signal peptide peptidase SppA, 67K type [Escherichia coli]